MASQITYDMTGKTVLVIGGTSGIGRACALAFAEAGANLVVGGLGLDDTAAFERELTAAGAARAIVAIVDVREEAAVAGVVKTAVDTFGRLDIALNNAGIEGPFEPLSAATSETFDRIIGVNLKGVFFGLKHEIRQMQAQGGGVILNTASNAGIKSISHIGIYSASKHGIIGLTKAAALETAEFGIRVNAMAPGPVDTGLLTRMVGGHVPLDAIAAKVPQGRIAAPAEIAALAIWLCSDAASYITGETVMIDGGATIA
ncbi:MAG: glucose 1-dehydrogenase [Caulobacteraceae bacterium]